MPQFLQKLNFSFVQCYVDIVRLSYDRLMVSPFICSYLSFPGCFSVILAGAAVCMHTIHDACVQIISIHRFLAFSSNVYKLVCSIQLHLRAKRNKVSIKRESPQGIKAFKMAWWLTVTSVKLRTFGKFHPCRKTCYMQLR